MVTLDRVEVGYGSYEVLHTKKKYVNIKSKTDIYIINLFVKGCYMGGDLLLADEIPATVLTVGVKSTGRLVDKPMVATSHMPTQLQFHVCCTATIVTFTSQFDQPEVPPVPMFQSPPLPLSCLLISRDPWPFSSLHLIETNISMERVLIYH